MIDNMTARRAAKYRDAIIGRMSACNARDLSDQEIERTLGPCVCGDWLVPCAQLLRDAGKLAYSDLDSVEQEIYLQPEVCAEFRACR